MDGIGGEDRRETKKLCDVYEIERGVVRYEEENKERSGEKIIEWVKSGKKIGVVSDGGVGRICDGGGEIVKDFRDIGGYVVGLGGGNGGLRGVIG